MNPRTDPAVPTPGREPAQASKPKQPARRRFITLFGRLLLGVWGVGIMAVITRFLRPRPGHHHRRGEVVIPDADLQELEVGAALLIAESDDPIHLVRVAQKEFIALSATCTHLRCILAFDGDSRTFVCPCHRGQFDLNGNVLGGLPSTPLERHRIVNRLGEVVVVKT